MTSVDHTFASMGTTARVLLECDRHDEAALERHARAIRAILEDVEQALSRFRPDSELSALNRDPRTAVPASPLLRHLARAIRGAGARSGGLVDATLLGPLGAAPVRRPARPHPARAHALIGVDAEGRIVRPPGVGSTRAAWARASPPTSPH